MKHLLRYFNRKHLYLIFCFYLAFAGVTFPVLSQQSKSDWRDNWNTLATLGVISGPFTGAIARHFQSCCSQFSFALFPYCAALLVGGMGFQLVPLSPKAKEGFFRLVVWCVGLLAWFGGGVVSFGH